MQYRVGVPSYKRVNNKKIRNYNLSISKIVVLLICGFMLSRVKFTVVEGLTVAPFGIAFLISVIDKKENKSLSLAFIGVIIGYLSIYMNSIDFWIYPMVAIILFLSEMVAHKINKKFKLRFVWIESVFIFISISCIFGNQGILTNIIFAVIKSIILIPSFYVINYGIKCMEELDTNYYFSIEELISMSILLCLVVAGMGNLNIFGVSVRNIVALSIIITVAFAGGASVGAVIGVTMGIIVGVTSSNILLFISLYSCSGLVVGVFKETGKVFSALSYLIVSFIVLTYSTSLDIYRIIEIITSALVMMVVPKKIIYRILLEISNEEKNKVMNDIKIEGVKDQFIDKIENLKEIFKEISSSMNKLSRNNKLDIKNKSSAMVENLADRVCCNCEMSNRCWEKEINKTFFEFSELIQNFEEGNNKITKALSNKCVKSSTLLRSCEELYNISAINEVLKKRLVEGREVLVEQVDNMANAVDDIMREFKRDVTSCYELDKVLRRGLSKNNIKYKDVYSFNDKNGRLKIKITMDNCYCENICVKKILPLLNEMLIVPFMVSDEGCRINPKTNECSIVIEESPKYHVLSYVAFTQKDGEDYSGDSFSFGKNKNGLYVTALSDGMGSGPEAGLESKVTIDLIDKFIECGYDEETAIKTINYIIAMKFNEDEKFATLDMNSIDLYSGEISFIKLGGVTSFIKRYERVEMISDNTLPLGAIDDAKYNKKKKKLKHGDIIVTISDGILDVDKNNIGDYSWLSTYLENATTNPEQLSRDILDKAKAMSNGKVLDDMTVIVSKLYSAY